MTPLSTETLHRNSWAPMLRSRPLQNAAARIETRADGGVTVSVRTDRRRWTWIQWLVPVTRERRALLDPLGTTVWRLCDGTRRVEDVIDQFATLHRLTFHEARVTVTQYMKALVQRGVLAMEMHTNHEAN